MSDAPIHDLILRVLVIDDNDQMRALLTGMLRSLGHEAIEAKNGRQAIERLSGSSVDIALVDILMPDMDGIEFIRLCRLGAIQPYIIAISGSPVSCGVDYLSVARKLGADAVMPKPFGKETLRSALRAARQGRGLLV